jgi:hypothetical protein
LNTSIASKRQTAITSNILIIPSIASLLATLLLVKSSFGFWPEMFYRAHERRHTMPGHRAVPPIWDFSDAGWTDHHPNERFAIFHYPTPVGGEDVVWDKETGLVWERSPSVDKLAWDPAIVQSFAKALAGRKGWRLPAMEELLSLADPKQSNPSLPTGHPFQNIKTDYFYWSSTLGMSNLPNFAWGYNFGNDDTSNLKTAQAYGVAGSRRLRT